MKGLKLSICVLAAMMMIASVGLAQEKGYSSPNPPSIEGGGSNDLCADAIGVGLDSLTVGTTIGATNGAAAFCGTSNSAPDVWYKVVGTGNTMTASFCNNGGTADYDSKISVYCDTCANQTCVAGNDDSCGLQSEVSWCSQAGFQYLILVHGFSSGEGNFELAVFDDAVGCPDPGICVEVPVEMMDFTVTDQ